MDEVIGVDMKRSVPAKGPGGRHIESRCPPGPALDAQAGRLAEDDPQSRPPVLRRRRRPPARTKARLETKTRACPNWSRSRISQAEPRPDVALRPPDGRPSRQYFGTIFMLWNMKLHWSVSRSMALVTLLEPWPERVSIRMRTGLGAGLGRLEGRRELERMGRDDAVVVIGRGHQGRGIADARLDVVERGIAVEVPEILLVVARAVLHHPAPADGELVVAEHVHDPDRREGHPEKVGPPGHRRPDEQAAVRAALDGQEVLRGVLLADQVFGRRDEVVEDVGLVEEHPRLVPGFAVFPAAAKAGLGVDPAVLEEDDEGRVEGGPHADVEPPVGGQEGRVLPVELEPLPVDDEHRDLGPVRARVEDLLGLVVGGIELDLRLPEHLGGSRRRCRT